MTAAGRPTTAPGPALLAAALPWDAGSVAQARGHARAAAVELELDGALQRACVLAASELVSNAVEHGTPPLQLRLWAVAGGLRLEVEDASPDVPQAVAMPLAAASGRGLAIVGAVSSAWGHYSTESGKCVWCDVVAATATGTGEPG
jgi:anti-sigma regulatory factor (Ser/Thr protein kinase)